EPLLERVEARDEQLLDGLEPQSLPDAQAHLVARQRLEAEVPRAARARRPHACAQQRRADAAAAALGSDVDRVEVPPLRLGRSRLGEADQVTVLLGDDD